MQEKQTAPSVPEFIAEAGRQIRAGCDAAHQSSQASGESPLAGPVTMTVRIDASGKVAAEMRDAVCEASFSLYL